MDQQSSINHRKIAIFRIALLISAVLAVVSVLYPYINDWIMRSRYVNTGFSQEYYIPYKFSELIWSAANFVMFTLVGVHAMLFYGKRKGPLMGISTAYLTFVYLKNFINLTITFFKNDRIAPVSYQFLPEILLPIIFLLCGLFLLYMTLTFFQVVKKNMLLLILSVIFLGVLFFTMYLDFAISTFKIFSNSSAYIRSMIWGNILCSFIGALPIPLYALAYRYEVN